MILASPAESPPQQAQWVTLRGKVATQIDIGLDGVGSLCESHDTGSEPSAAKTQSNNMTAPNSTVQIFFLQPCLTKPSKIKRRENEQPPQKAQADIVILKLSACGPHGKQMRHKTLPTPQ